MLSTGQSNTNPILIILNKRRAQTPAVFCILSATVMSTLDIFYNPQCCGRRSPAFPPDDVFHAGGWIQASPAFSVSFGVLPIPLIIGLLLIPLGAWHERRRLRRGQPASRLAFSVDLAVPRQRAALTMFSSVSAIVLLFTAYGSYRTFEWTESVEFCGTTCHSVMEPEHTAYQYSPHARVKCVDCHVGSGAGWYVRSKLSGAYQVYAVLANVYPRPIPTPIKNLRPAQETCEQCHWPPHLPKKSTSTPISTDERTPAGRLRALMKLAGE
jgi:hypothetical protein